VRDDFSSSVKDIVSKRFGLLCSNPDCGMLTMGPNSNENKTTNIGVAAHITAASSGGPRFNGALTQEDRCSISNAIWLCQSCSKLIDSDTSKYPVRLLIRWKEEAERLTELKLNKQRTTTPKENHQEIFNLMPELINEIVGDLKANPIFREFILQQKGWIYNSGGKQILVYYYEDHDNLHGKIRLLENNGLVTDITHNNTLRYVFEEKFIQELKHLGQL
jgi:hypothetical protein